MMVSKFYVDLALVLCLFILTFYMYSNLEANFVTFSQIGKMIRIYRHKITPVQNGIRWNLTQESQNGEIM